MLEIFLFATLWTGLQASPVIPDKGVPAMQHFAPSDYRHAGKIWNSAVAPGGIVYMASDKGLLEFDGAAWVLTKGSEGVIRSVYAANDSVLYTGSDRDFGVWKRDAYQRFVYTSLYPFRDELASVNEEFWTTARLDEYMVFISSAHAYLYRNQTLTKIPLPQPFHGAFADSSGLYIAADRFLYHLSGPGLTRAGIFQEPVPDLAGVYSSGDMLYVVTRSGDHLRRTGDRFAAVEHPARQLLRRAGVFSFSSLPGGGRAYGTVSSGLVLTGPDGVIRQHINKGNGLPNNTVLSIRPDPAGTLWLGMDYGITAVRLAHPVTYFMDNRGTFGTGHTAVLHGADFYLGTNQGLYRAAWSGLSDRGGSIPLELVPGSEGQVWHLSVHENELLAGHDRGLFVLNGSGFQRISAEPGVWTLIRFRDRYLAGTYHGIRMLQKTRSGWQAMGEINGMYGSCNQMVSEGDSVLWIHIPNYGIVRAALDASFAAVRTTRYVYDQFSGGNPVLFDKEGTVTVRSGRSEYQWSASARQFTPLPAAMGPDYPQQERMPGGLLPATLNLSWDFYPVYNGFALRRRDVEPVAPRSGAPVFRFAEAFNSLQSEPLLPGGRVRFEINNIRVRALIPNRPDVLYEFKSGDLDWTEPQPGGVYERLGLPAGTLPVRIRARMPDGSVSAETRVLFVVDPPWYRSYWAMAGAGLLLLVTVVFLYRRFKIIVRRQEDQFKSQQMAVLDEQEERHRQLLREMEQKNLMDAYDQVKNQLKYKTMELARKARENEIKNQLLDTIKEKFEQLKLHPESLKSRAAEIQRLLDSYISLKDETFEIQLNELHQDFFEKLKQRVHGLSPHDLKLCAYIKMGFNAKEISELLNIQPSSVYISRSRLRKKLNIESEEDLHAYLNSI